MERAVAIVALTGQLRAVGMQRQFTRFVESPSRENYFAVRDAVLRLTPLPLAASELAELVRLLEADEFQEVLDRIELLPPSKILSPRIHFLAAEAAEGLGDERTGELERFLFVLCLKALLATGDGTEAAPYSVCHATDEHDVLEAGGLEPAAQCLVPRDGRLCDVITCSDGRQIWFDVTALFLRPKPRRKEAARKRRRVTATVGKATVGKATAGGGTNRKRR
jgi:hypothetical protein